MSSHGGGFALLFCVVKLRLDGCSRESSWNSSRPFLE
jgi:hypothetical protein